MLKIGNNSPKPISKGGRVMLKDKQKRLLRELGRMPFDELVSQKELAWRAGIDITTVNAYLKMFIDQGMVFTEQRGERNNKKYFLAREKLQDLELYSKNEAPDIIWALPVKNLLTKEVSSKTNCSFALFDIMYWQK